MCRQQVSYDVRADALSPGEVAIVNGRCWVLACVSHEGRYVMLEDLDSGDRHYASPDRLFSVYGEGER